MTRDKILKLLADTPKSIHADRYCIVQITNETIPIITQFEDQILFTEQGNKAIVIIDLNGEFDLNQDIDLVGIIEICGLSGDMSA